MAANIHTTSANAVKLVWGSLKLAGASPKYVPVWPVCSKDSAKPCMHLYLNCIGNTNSTQSLFRDNSVVVGVVAKELYCHQKCCGGMGCAVMQQACNLVYTSSIKVTSGSVWLCCIGSLLPESCSHCTTLALELQVRMKFGVVMH